MPAVLVFVCLPHLGRRMTFIVRANPYLLGIALQNVVDNACKYSDKDVEISLFEKEGRRVVEIRDQGIGIPQEEVELIFSIFLSC